MAGMTKSSLKALLLYVVIIAIFSSSFLLDRWLEFIGSSEFILGFLTNVSFWLILATFLMTVYYTGMDGKLRDAEIGDLEVCRDKGTRYIFDYVVHLQIHLTAFLVGVVAFGFDQFAFFSRTASDISEDSSLLMDGKTNLLEATSIILVILGLLGIVFYFKREKKLMMAYRSHDHSQAFGMPDNWVSYLRLFTLWMFVFIGIHCTFYEYKHHYPETVSNIAGNNGSTVLMATPPAPPQKGG